MFAKKKKFGDIFLKLTLDVEGVVLVVGWAVRKVVVLTKLVGLGVKWVVADLKDQLKLNGCLYFCDDRRATHVKYHCLLGYSD
jgi:hypothetical protein